MPDLGVARGVVQIDYKSSGADKVQRETQSVAKYTDKARDSFAKLAEKAGLSSDELSKFSEVSRRVGKATDDLTKAQQKFDAAMSASAKVNPKDFTDIVSERAKAKKAVQDTTKAYEDWLKVVQTKTPGLKFDGRQFTTSAKSSLDSVANAFRSWGQQQSGMMGNIGTRLGDSLGKGMLSSVGRGTTAVAGAITNGIGKAGSALGHLGGRLGSALMSGLSKTASASAGPLGSIVGFALGKSINLAMKGALAGVAALSAGLGAGLGLGFKELNTLDVARVKMTKLGKSGKEIQSIFADVKKAIEGTGFGIDEMAAQATKALAFGVKPGKDLTQYLKNLGDMAAQTGGTLDGMSNIMQRLMQNGKIQGEDMLMLVNQGVPVLKWAAEDAGVTVDQMRAKLKDGSISVQQFQDMVQKHIGGAAQDMTKTLGGARSRMAASLAGIGSNFFGSLFGLKPGQGDVIAAGINKISDAVDGLANFMGEHQKGIIDFWRVLGKIVLTTAKIITTGVQYIGASLISLVEGLADVGGWATQIGAKLAGLFGAKGIQKDWEKAAKSMHGFGEGIRRNFDQGTAAANQKLDSGWVALEKWSDGAKDAADSTADLGDQAGDTGSQLETITDALEKLDVNLDTVAAGVKGTQKEFSKLLDTLRKNGASQDLINTLTRLHNEYRSTGRSAESLSKAIDAVNDSSEDASSSSQALIKALRDVGALAGNAESALSSYNDAVDKVYDPNNKFVDILDATGKALIDVNGNIDTATSNGRSLWKETDTLVTSMAALMASGADVNDTYANTSKTFHDLLAQFGIFGQDADRLTEKYFGTPQQWEIQMSVKGQTEVQKALAAMSAQLEAAKRKGDTDLTFKVNIDEANAAALKEAVEKYGGIWKEFDPITGQATIDMSKADVSGFNDYIAETSKKDPAKFQTELDLKTSRSDIVNQIAPPGNPLKIPTVLDIQTPIIPGMPGAAPTGPAPITARPGESLDQPLSPERRREMGIPDSFPPIYPSAPPPEQTVPNAPQGKPAPSNLPGGPSVFDPNGLPTPPGVSGRADDPFAIPTGPPPTLSGLTTDSNKLQKTIDQGTLLGQLPADAVNTLNDVSTHAKEQGQTLSEAFAQGIADGDEKVKQALLALAQYAPDILGNSPAKYGPLSGSGWTFERGRNFTKAFAGGISSEGDSVKGAVTSVATSGTSPFDERLTKMIGDLQELSDFGKSLTNFISSVANIAFGVVSLFGGNKKSYVKDTKALAPSGGKGLGSDVFGGAGGRGYQNMGAVGAAPTAKPEGKQGTVDYIIQKAMSLGYSRAQADQFVVQAAGESGFNPEANGGNQDGTGDVRGVFQFTPGTWGNRPGSITNAKDNIDAYFQLAKERGLTPESFTDPSQLGTQVSIGGPLHPDNAAKGHLDNAKKLAAPYIAAFGGGAGLPGGAGLGGVIDASKLPAGMAQNRDKLSPNAQLLDNAITAVFGDELRARGLTIGGYRAHDAGSGEHSSGGALDIMTDKNGQPTAEGKALGNRINKFVQDNAKAFGLDWSIWNDTFQAPGNAARPYSPIAGTGNGPTTRHENHVHAFTGFNQQATGTGMFNLPLGPDGTMQVSLPWTDSDALRTSATALDNLPTKLGDFLRGDPKSLQAYQAAKGMAGGPVSDAQATDLIQHLDTQIATQSKLGTPMGDEMAKSLGTVRSKLMEQHQLTEGSGGGMDQATGIYNSVSGLVKDAFDVFDSTLKSIQSTHDIAQKMNRGIANTEDVMDIVDKIQAYIELGANISKTVSDGLSLASQIAGSSPDMGGQGASSALGAASTIASLISQAFAAVNTVIDLAQEAYRITSKYATRGLLNWLGFPGASDMNYLLESKTGKLKTWASENPQDKHVFNDMNRLLTGNQTVADKDRVINNLTVYQGPGQDPRDSMNDAMFMIRSSGVGAFGYA